MRARFLLGLLAVVVAAGAIGFVLGRLTTPAGGDERALARLDASEIQATFHVGTLTIRRAAPRHWIVRFRNDHCAAIDLARFYVDSKTRYGGISSVSCGAP